MLKRMGYWWVPAGSFVLAIVMSFVCGPRAVLTQGTRAPAAVTQPPTCTVTATAPVARRQVGNESIRDADKEELEEAIESGLAETGMDTSPPDVQQFIQDQATGILDGTEDAATISFIEFSFTFTTDVTGAVDNVVITYTDHLVVLQHAPPVGAKLAAHEEGHVTIHQLLAAFAKGQLEKACHERILGKVLAEAAIAAIISEVVDNLRALGRAADKAYDKLTKNGTVGPPNQQRFAATIFGVTLITGGLFR